MYGNEGLAQIKPEQYDAIKENSAAYLDYSSYNIPKDPYDALQTAPVSTAAMIDKLAPIVRVCQNQGCLPTDQEIAICMGQNGDSFTEDALREIIKSGKYQSNDNPSTIVDWKKVVEDDKPYSFEIGGGVTKTISSAYKSTILNWRSQNSGFERRFMLQRCYLNAMEMQTQGWELPSEVDWDYIHEILEDTSPSG